VFRSPSGRATGMDIPGAGVRQSLFPSGVAAPTRQVLLMRLAHRAVDVDDLPVLGAVEQELLVPADPTTRPVVEHDDPVGCQDRAHTLTTINTSGVLVSDLRAPRSFASVAASSAEKQVVEQSRSRPRFTRAVRWTTAGGGRRTRSCRPG